MDLYIVLQELGKGTFGTVHLCQRKHSNQKIVIKTINIEQSDTVQAKNEVTILKSLNHPNIIQYYDSFVKKETLYIVMEYASQGTLKDYLVKHKQDKLSPQSVMNLFCQILMGLHHIHERKVIHRDLKCENIFLTGQKSDVVKIGDFGISKILIQNKNANTLIGTCNYIAPELCEGKPYNIKSDIWSLGCILYELCEIEKMFQGTLSNIVMSIATGRHKQVNTEIYGIQIQDIIEMMLKIDPEERPDTTTLMTLPDIFPSLTCLGANLGCLNRTDENKEKYLKE